MTVRELIKLLQTTVNEKDKDELTVVWQGMSNRVYDVEPRIKTTNSGRVLLMNP